MASDSLSGTRLSDWTKVITLITIVVTSFISMAIWATASHADIKDWTAEQDFVTKVELQKVMERQYVPLHEFTTVRQSLEDTRHVVEKMDAKIDKILAELHTRR